MDTDSRAAVPGWFWGAAIASILFMAIGVAGFFMDVGTDPHTLAPAQRELFIARPVWMKLAYMIAVWSGLIGALILVFRRRIAVPILLLSLIATILTFLPYAVVPRVRAAVGQNDVIAAIVVLVFVALIYVFARTSRQRGWLR
jgi:hypothetical protein